MFDDLNEKMKADEHQAESNTERYTRWAVVAVVSVVLFGALYFGVTFLN